MLRVGLALAMVGLAACGGDDDGPGDTGVRVYRLFECMSADEAPFRTTGAAAECRRVGIDPAAEAMGEFADATGFTMPVYVRAGASGGDGSVGSPFGTLAEAAAVIGADAILLGRGEHTVAAPVSFAASIAIVGAGANATTLQAPAGTAITLAAGGSVRGLKVVSPATGENVAIEITGGAATVEEAAIEGSVFALVATGATADLTATNVTIEGAARVGVLARDGARGALDSVLIRDGERYGIVSVDSVLDLASVFVTRHVRDGIAFLGGGPHTATDVVSSQNGVTGMRVELAAALTARRLVLQGTHVPDGLVGGDGLWIASGSSVLLDAELPATDASRGLGSALVANERTGAAADGTGTTFSMHGAVVLSNEGPGIFMQQMARSDVLGYALVEDNGALGIGIASGANVAAIPCDVVIKTRMSDLTTTLGTVRLGDGLSITEGAVGDSTMVVGNDFSDNARYAAVMSGANVTASMNTGSGNRYPITAWGGTTMIDATNTVEGARASPADPDITARGQINAAGIVEMPPP